MMHGCVVLVLPCLLALGVLQSRALHVEVKDDANKTCIFASLMVNFTVHYETNTNDTNVSFSLPDNNVTLDKSICGSESVGSLLWIHFGSGHSWILNFTRNATVYRGSAITFTYNLSDSHLFPDAKSNGTLTRVSNVDVPPAVPLNTMYMCNSVDVVTATDVVQTLWDVTLQAFVENGTIGSNASQCEADTPVTPVVPVSTIYPPTAAPIADEPITGNYSFSSGNMSLLATMGLQLNISQASNKTTWITINIDPNNTSVTGTCDNDTATLRLNSNNTRFLSFIFAVRKNNFYLKEVNVSLLSFLNGSAFSDGNGNLSYWETSLGSSYMCNSEQRLQVTDSFLLNTFNLRVQPFLVVDGKFSTAQECSLDDDTILIPIIVGAALAGLIVIIVLAYIIGRRKSYAGYQTL
ncbi:lysosome-associated membrane glycoprotein 2 isoform X2 [Microcaecilia unicolor]|uniref:Lysosome-associated membrane glycoprotein 2 n=1 Tax=Microcaecilia unicolor TaxID=1415580 RepID=A0A6P7YT69_9AMPH|nr:lysosome-associated membrane glycoprotein 2 isoform X2 [Microcaecilia unicolor]